MGIPVPAAKQMSLWEMAAVTERWIEAHDTEGRDSKGKMDDAEKDEIWAWMEKKGVTGRKRTNGAGHG
jgi:hypothetical protein